MVLSYSDSEVKGGAAVMDEKQLKAEYRKWRQQETPDLWSRIESNLKEHSDREKDQEETKKIRSFQPGRRIFPTSAVAAAAVAVMVAVKMLVPDFIGDAVNRGLWLDSFAVRVGCCNINLQRRARQAGGFVGGLNGDVGFHFAQRHSNRVDIGKIVIFGVGWR